MTLVLAPVSLDGLAARVEHGHRLGQRRLAALAGRHAGHDVGAVVLHLLGVEAALAAGDALDEQSGVGADEDAHAATGAWLAIATTRSTASSSVSAVCEVGIAGVGQDLGRQVGVRAHDAHHHGHVALLLAARLDQAVGDLVAAGDAAEDVDEDRAHVAVGQDQPHGRGDLVVLGAAADVEEVGRLAAGALDQVHGRHRQPGAVDHAADGAFEPDERDALLARRDIDRILLGEVAQQLQVRVAGERRVVDRDLGVQALERFAGRAVGQRVADDGQRVDLHQVGVVVDHRREDALGDGHEVAQVLAAEAHLEGQVAGLVVEQPEVRVRLDLLDRVGVGRRRPPRSRRRPRPSR